MKSIYTGLIVALLLAFVSCRKHPENIPFGNTLIAAWKWTNSTGGVATHTVYPSSNTVVTLEFYSDSSYIAYRNGQAASQGTFSSYLSRNFNVVHFDKPIVADKLYMDFDQTVTIDNGKLILYDFSVSDGIRHYFEQAR